MRRTIFTSGLALALLALPAMALVQIQIGTVRGTVTDAVGARLPGAKVTLSNMLTGYHEARTTDERGEFTFNNVPFDGYSLQAAVSGFQVASQRVSVRSNVPITLDVKLTVAGAAEAVHVKALEPY